MEVIRDRVPITSLAAIAQGMFGYLVKAVVDVERRIMVIGGELHADEEALLISAGSRQMDLWGINLYPEAYGSAEFVEYDSMINIRPGQGNRSRSVDDASTRARIAVIVEELVAA